MQCETLLRLPCRKSTKKRRNKKFREYITPIRYNIMNMSLSTLTDIVINYSVDNYNYIRIETVFQASIYQTWRDIIIINSTKTESDNYKCIIIIIIIIIIILNKKHLQCETFGSVKCTKSVSIGTSIN